jgi:hypothetical protein
VSPRGRIGAFALLTLWGLLLGGPLLRAGFPVDGHDFWAHTTWGGHFARQFWDGEPYPRWLAYHNEGLGSPTFFFYPPLPFWLTSLLTPLFVAETAPVSALAWVATAMLVLSGIFTYLWLRQTVALSGALAAAAIYQLAPYHLLIDLYQRAAFAEFCAMTWIPLMLLAASRLARGRQGGFALLALATALLVLTHLLSLLMIGPVVAAYAAVCSDAGSRLRSFATSAAAMGLGLGLSGVYLVPALSLQKYVNTQVLWQGWGHYRQYLYDWELVLAADQHIFHLLLLLTLASTVALAMLFYLLAAAPPPVGGDPHKASRDRRILRFWMLLALAVAFLMTEPSDLLWRIATPLQRLQFPWRLAMVLTVATTALAAPAVANLRSDLPWRRRLLVYAAVIILGGWAIATTLGGLNILRQPARPELNARAQDAWEYKPRWIQGEDFQAAVRQSKDAEGRIPRAELSAGGEVRVEQWRPRHIRLSIDATADSRLTVFQFYFPGWRATLDGRIDLPVQPSTPHGFVSAQVPAGRHSIELRMLMTPNERNGWLLSGASALVWLASVVVTRGLRRR